MKKVYKQIEMSQLKEGFTKPFVSPVPALNEGLFSAVSKAISNSSTRKLELGTVTREEDDEAKGYSTAKVTYSPFFTFTRTGPQEFADDRGAWWDSIK